MAPTRAPARRKRLLVLHNPLAGLAGRARVDAVVSALRRAGAAVEFVGLRQGVPTAEALAGVPDVDALVAAGGDGTLRSVLMAIAGRSTPVGLIPVGTGNVFAHEVGLPRSAEDLASVLLSGPAVDVRGALGNAEPFFLMAGAGFDGSVIRRLDPRLKSRIGKLAYAGPVLRALAEPPPVLAVTIDGVAHEAEWIVAARSRCYGGGFTLAPRASLLRDGLVAVVFAPTHRAGRIARLLALAAGRIEGLAGVTHVPCTTVTVRAGTTGRAAVPVPVEVDGDPFGTTPIEITANGPTVSLVVPATYAASARED